MIIDDGKRYIPDMETAAMRLYDILNNSYKRHSFAPHLGIDDIGDIADSIPAFRAMRDDLFALLEYLQTGNPQALKEKNMTVRELINKLQEFDGSLDVQLVNFEGDMERVVDAYIAPFSEVVTLETDLTYE